MAMQSRISVEMAAVFRMGAFAVGDVSAAEDYDARISGASDHQQRDKESGKPVWVVRVVDADPEARKGQAEVQVKIASTEMPVLPPTLPGLPFRPVEFEDLTITPYVDTNGARPRLNYSIRASGLRAPKGPKTPVLGA